MTDLLSIGAQGLKVYTQALGAVGDNIANANTVGYARRTLSISEISSGSTRSIIYKPQARFDGSEVNGVVRNVDLFRTADSRLAAADDGRASTLSTWMQTTETSLNKNLSGSLASVFAAGDQLAAAPTGVASRLTLISAVDTAASAIRNGAQDLVRNAQSLSASATELASNATGELKSLASLNLLIRKQTSGSTSKAELEDQRDRILDSLSERLGVSYTTAQDGTTRVTVNGTTLVDIGDAATIEPAVGADGRIAFRATMTGTTSTLSLTNGTGSGIVTVSGTIADRRTQLDGLATTFANLMNNWNTAGTTATNVAGSQLVTMTGDATTLSAVAVGVDEIGAQSANGTANGNALALRGAGLSSNVESVAAQIVAQHAAATSGARNAESLASERRDTANTARDKVEGVDLDREAADMLRYQQAYQGAARMIQVAKETVDSILALFN